MSLKSLRCRIRLAAVCRTRAARILATMRVQFEFYLAPQVSGRRLATVKTVTAALRKAR